jgi:hypothetical protein
MEEKEILWASAMVSIFENPQSPNLRPLVALLRSDMPMTASARDMLANLIDPDGDGCLYKRFKLVDISNGRNGTSKDIKKMLICSNYRERLDKGERAEDIVYDLAEKNSLSEKTIYNYVRDIESLRKWLAGDG